MSELKTLVSQMESELIIAKTKLESETKIKYITEIKARYLIKKYGTLIPKLQKIIEN